MLPAALQSLRDAVLGGTFHLGNGLPANLYLAALRLQETPPTSCVARQTPAMVRAAGELRKQKVLDTASAPWEPTQLRSALSVAPAQNVTPEAAEQHANVLAVRACTPHQLSGLLPRASSPAACSSPGCAAAQLEAPGP